MGLSEKQNEIMIDTWLEVIYERKRQNKKWGLQRQSYGSWLAILVEEVGEVAQAMQKDMVSQKETDADDLFKELIQVAAVASAIAEQIKEESNFDE